MSAATLHDHSATLETCLTAKLWLALTHRAILRDASCSPENPNISQSSERALQSICSDPDSKLHCCDAAAAAALPRRGGMPIRSAQRAEMPAAAATPSVLRSPLKDRRLESTEAEMARREAMESGWTAAAAGVVVGGGGSDLAMDARRGDAW